MTPPDEDLDLLAGQYVLGTLAPDACSALERRMPHDAALRQAVRAWEVRLHPLTDVGDAIEPSPQLWQRIERSLARVQVLRADPWSDTGQGDRVVGHEDRGHARGDRTRMAIQTQQPRWWSRPGPWRTMSGAGLALAAVLLAVVVSRTQAPPAAPTFLVVLVAPQDRAPGWVVQAGERGAIRLMPVASVTVPPEKALEFWTKADGWAAPVSLGVVRPGQVFEVPLDRLPPLQPDQLFELTLEPSGGSPLGRPTGPIQFIGRAVKVL